jgi:hypothetical protein
VELNPTIPQFQYGRSALELRLVRMPRRPLPQPYPETDPLTDLECSIVDDWAIALFGYCRRRSGTGLRMCAMLVAAEQGLWTHLIREGCPPSVKAMRRLEIWKEWAARIPPT